MKYRITNKKLNEIILNHLDSYFVPDYGWSTDFYSDELSFGYSIDFSVDDYDAYYYNEIYGPSNSEKVLTIEPWVSDKLYGLFGTFWVLVFKQWFETNTGLEVKNMIFGRAGSEMSYTKLTF